MTKQTKRRRKRYEPGSAYAGDIKPRGIFAVFGNVKLFFVVGVLIMGGSLLVGGILRSGALGGSTTNPGNNFVLPPKTPGTGTPNPQATAVIKHYASAPAMTIDPSKHYVATIKTSLGSIQVNLLASQVPQTVNNFVFLAKDGFYNGLTFWYVNPNVDAQVGDPGCTTGQTSNTCRGSGDPGYQLAAEHPATPLPYSAGTLGMANASQFFIALSQDSHFDQFTPFGKITSGFDVAQRISRGTPIESITIQAQ